VSGGVVREGGGKMEGGGVGGGLGGGLRSMAQGMAINRAVRRQPLVTGEADTLDGSAVERHTPLDRAIAGERQRQVRAGLKRLKSMGRETLGAVFGKGHSPGQVRRQVT